MNNGSLNKLGEPKMMAVLALLSALAASSYTVMHNTFTVRQIKEMEANNASELKDLNTRLSRIEGQLRYIKL